MSITLRRAIKHKQQVTHKKNYQANQIITDQLIQIVNHQTIQKLIGKSVEAIMKMK